MTSMEDLRAGVRLSLPELADFDDPQLADKVVEAWALSLHGTEFSRIEDLPGSPNPGPPELIDGDQATHIRGVGRLSVVIGEELERILGPIGVSRDFLYAGGVCHDLGKPFENSPANRARWAADPGRSGYPAIRHSIYGVHLALTVGLPEEIAHVCGAHSGEGELIYRSTLNSIVNHADHVFWGVAEKAGLMSIPTDLQLQKKG